MTTLADRGTVARHNTGGRIPTGAVLRYRDTIRRAVDAG